MSDHRSSLARFPGNKQSVTNDPGDRMIAATAVDLGLQLVTSDKKLRALPSGGR
jgi:PIN domain nuclease of toxin-antitoxin system